VQSAKNVLVIKCYPNSFGCWHHMEQKWSSLCDDAGDRRCDERPGAHGCLNSSSCTQRSWQHIRNLWWTSSATDACSKYQPAQHFTFVMLTIYCQVLALKQFLRALSHLCG